MKKIIILMLSIITIYNSYSQKYDYQWLFGYGENKGDRFGLTLLDFNNSDVDVSFFGSAKSYSLGFTGSIIDNRQGKILFLTNNCDVRDADWNIISGDDPITPTGSTVRGCEYKFHRYSAEQSALFLPDLMDTQLIYLLHKDFDVDFETQTANSNYFYFSTIKKVNGQYKYKNIYIDSTKKMMGLRLTACPNRQKNKWWVLMPKNHSKVFKRYLIGNDTVIEKDSIITDLELTILDLDIGQAQYSPDGTMLGINSEKYGVLLYDFNNENGEISGPVIIPYPDSNHIATGLCFSPNNRFIYVTTVENVYQIDLEENNEVYHVGHFYSPDEENWPVGLGAIFAGPDCRLYVSPATTTYYLHTILYPDEKGAECKFVEKALELPTNMAHDLPNLPQYRYLSGCDTSIVFPFKTSVLEDVLAKIEFKIYPNPASDYIEVILTKMDRWSKWAIIDVSGKIELKGTYSDMKKIDISTLMPGMYFLRLTDKSGKVITNKFVKY